MNNTDLRHTTYLQGVVLPNVRDSHPNTHSEQTEYDKRDVSNLNITGVPLLMNHADELCEVGHVVAFEPMRDGHAWVVGAFDANTDSGVAIFVRNALLGGHYDSLSLTHCFKSFVRRSAVSGDRMHTRKTAIEVSVCDEPGRAGAHVKEYLPSHDDLAHANHHFLANFAQNYRYPAPPQIADPSVYGAVNANRAKSVPALLYYVDHTLYPLVQARLRKLFDQHGSIRASARHMTPSTHQSMQEQGTNTNSAPGTHTATSVPTPMNTETTNTTQQPAAAAPTGMAIDNGGSGAQQTTVVETPSSTNLLETPTENDSPSVVMAKLAAQNKAFSAQLAAYQQKEADITKAAEIETEKQRVANVALEKQKASRFQTGAQSAVDIWAKALDAPPEEVEQAKSAMGGLVTLLNEKGASADEMTKTLGTLGEVFVRASGRSMNNRAERDLSALQAQASRLARDIGQSKSFANVSGGEFTPPIIAATGTVSASATKRVRVDPPPQKPTETPATIGGAASFNPFGLPSNDAVAGGAAEQAAVATGTVHASRAKMGASAEPIDPLAQLTEQNFYENVRAVYESLAKFDGEGNMEVPSLSEVAQGGVVLEGVVKRNFAGEQVEHVVERPRFKNAMPIGVQHLFPDVFKKMTEPYTEKRSALNSDGLQTMAQLAEELFPESQQLKRRADNGLTPNYSPQFYWVDQQWQGSENIMLPMSGTQ